MNGPTFHYSDDYIALVARERHSQLLHDAAQRRALRDRDVTRTRTRSRFLRWR